MLNAKRISFYVFHVLMVSLIVSVIAITGCSKGPVWKAVNEQVIEEQGVTMRYRDDIPETGVVSNLEEGVVTDLDTLGKIQIAPGVTGQIYYGAGAMVSLTTMAPGSEIPVETLAGERIMIMTKGSVEQLINGQYVKMECTELAPAYYYATGYIGTQDFLILDAGSENAVKAGPDGAEFREVYSPVRLDYIEKSGAPVPAKFNPGTLNATPNFPYNTVLNLNEVQYTELVPGADAKLINGKNAQASVLFMQPGSTFGHHTHPEHQIMIGLSGHIDEIILDGTQPIEAGDVLNLPGQMVHGGVNGPAGCLAMDVFWPVRVDYQGFTKNRMDAVNTIIPAGEKAKLVAEGFKFTEGPVWLDGTLYFSSMFFDIPAGTWQTDASKSDLIAMKPDGTWKKLWAGKTQTNGLMAKGNGNLVACDMSGHRVLEIDPKSGRIVKVLASHMNDGTRLDGPNDVVIDAKGGIYFTDPQFIFDEAKQPGKTVNYIKPDGEVIRVIDVGEIGMANGVLLSPDGKVLYANNTYHDENRMSDVENWVVAYDVNDDGTLSNKRKFAKLFIPISEYEIGTRSSCADGMTIDTEGNIYVATNIGLQIFNSEGTYIGNVYTPDFPVSACFGGENNDIIYMTCWDKVYSIQTNMTGLVYPLK